MKSSITHLPNDIAKATERRLSFRRPPHDLGVAFGLGVRLVVGVVAVLFAMIVAMIAGAFSGWQLNGTTVLLMGGLIFFMVLFGEHLRYQAFERIRTQVGATFEVELDANGIRIDGAELFEPRHSSRSFLLALRLKRLLDVVIAATAIVSLLPLFIVIGTFIKLSDPGPILFAQRRFGIDGRTILIWKFRTIYYGHEARGVQQTAFGRPITPIGRILRRTALDELPMLLSVLKGDLSLVGTSLYPFEIAYPNIIHSAAFRPGILTLARVSGSRHITAGGLRDTLQYDAEYVATWSFLSDLRILALAVRRLIRGT